MRKFSVIKSAFRSMKRDPTEAQKKPQGILEWLRVLKSFNDEDLKVICGTDGALYLVFQRYAALFFFCITLVNLLVFIPVYASGSPADIKDVEDENNNVVALLLVSVMNITGHGDKQVAVYAIMLLFYSASAFLFMFSYWKKSNLWRYKEHAHDGAFLDHDVALHSLMVTNLPTQVPLPEMSRRLRLVFERLFPDARLVAAKAVAKLDGLFALASRLRALKKDLRYFRRLNQAGPRKQLRKRRRCCRESETVDAEDHTREKIRKKLRDIKRARALSVRTNGGFGFVSFISNLQVKKCLYKNEYKALVCAGLSQEERVETQALQWRIRQAPSQSDIIWENMYKDDGVSEVKSWFLVLLLFVGCVVLITPVSVVDNLKPLIDALSKKLGDKNFLVIVLSTYLSPLILLIFNFGIIPLLIDLIAFLEDHKTKSLKQLSIMRKNFFFQLFNTVFLQLTAQSTILAFIEVYANSNWQDLPKEMGQKLVNNNFFFLRYTIQLAFISNGVQLLDIPHHLVKAIKYTLHRVAQRREETP